MKKRNKVIKPNVVGGGVAIPLGNNFYFMRGRKHEQGGIDIGPNNKNGLEVEGGEVMQMGGKHVKVYSSLPILNGKSPAELVIAGLNPDKVFNAQERFKDIHKLNDDGSKKARFGKRQKGELGTMWVEDEFGNIVENDKPIIPEPYSEDKPIKNKPIKDIAYRIMTQMPGADRNIFHVGKAFNHHIYKKPVPLHYTGGASPEMERDDEYVTWDNPKRNLAKLYLTGESGDIEQIPDNYRGFDYTEYLKKNKYNAKTYRGEILPDEVVIPKGYEYVINNMETSGKSVNAYNYDNEFDDVANHKQQIGRDERGNLEIQASDVWDFQPNDYAKLWKDKFKIKPYIQASMLNTIGKPFILRDYSKIKFTDNENDVNIPNSVKHWLYEYPIKKEDVDGMPHYSLENNEIEMIFDKHNINKKPIVRTNTQTYKPERKRLGGFNRHFTINGNVMNKAGYVPSTGERKKAVTGTITKEEFLSQLPNNNLTTVGDNTTVETSNIIKPDLSSLRNNPKFQSKPYDFSAEMSKTIAKVQEDNTPKGYISKNGVFIPTLDTFKKQEIQKMINESVRRSNERTAPTNIRLGRLSQDDIIELNDTLQNPTQKLRIDQRDSIQKQLDDNCKYGYTCATTASSNMPRLKDVTKVEGIGYKDRNFMDWDNGVLINPGYFASNSDFRKNYKDYGYELVDDVNHPNVDENYKEFVNNLQGGDLVQRWTTDNSGFAPRHLMTYVGNDGGDILFVNDSTGQFTPSAIRKNHKYMLMNPDVGTSVYRFVGDKKDHETMENIYNHLYGDSKRLGGKRIKAQLGLEGERENLYNAYLKADLDNDKKEKRRIRKEFNKLSKKLDANDNETVILTRFAGDDGTYLKTRKNKGLKVDKNKKADNTKVTKKTINHKEKSVTTPKLETFDIASLSKNLEQYKINEEKRTNRKKWLRDNGSDLISGVTKGGASLASYLVNKNMLNDLKYVGQPIFTPATKLKTKININPQIDAISRTTDAKNANVSANTASSKVRNARMNANYIDRLGYLNELYGMKENKETELINKDRLNQQEITKGNIQAYNDWAEKKQTFENTVRDKQSENAVSFVTNLATGVDDILSNRLKRKQFDQNIAAIKARNPNVPDELLEESGVTVIKKLGGLNTRKLKIRKPNK